MEIGNKSLRFNNELIALIRKEYPGALKGDLEENAACARDISVALGGMIAFAYKLNGAVAGRTTLQGIVKAIIENMAAIDEKASQLAIHDIKQIN